MNIMKVAPLLAEDFIEVSDTFFDIEEYQKFILTKLAKLDIISNINSQFVLKPIKYSTSINLKFTIKKPD